MFDALPLLCSKTKCVRFRVTFGHIHRRGWAVTVWLEVPSTSSFKKNRGLCDTVVLDRHYLEHRVPRDVKKGLIRTYTELFADKLEQNGYMGVNLRKKEMLAWETEVKDEPI